MYLHSKYVAYHVFPISICIQWKTKNMCSYLCAKCWHQPLIWYVSARAGESLQQPSTPTYSTDRCIEREMIVCWVCVYFFLLKKKRKQLEHEPSQTMQKTCECECGPLDWQEARPPTELARTRHSQEQGRVLDTWASKIIMCVWVCVCVCVCVCVWFFSHFSRKQTIGRSEAGPVAWALVDARIEISHSAVWHVERVCRVEQRAQDQLGTGRKKTKTKKQNIRKSQQNV